MSIWRYWTGVVIGVAGAFVIGDGHDDVIWPVTIGCLTAGGAAGWGWDSANLRHRTRTRPRAFSERESRPTAGERRRRTR